MLKPSRHNSFDLSALYWVGRGEGTWIFKKTALLFATELVKRIELKLRSDCPKDLAFNEGSILWSNLQTQGDKFIELLSKVSMTRTSVLSSFSSNLPSISHFRESRMHSSIARSATSCALSSPALKLRYSCASTAKQWTCGRWRSITLNSEEVLMTNSKGPRQEPWGTPQSSDNCLESNPSMETCWLRFKRYELNQSTWPIKPSHDPITNLVKCYLMLGGNERCPKGDAFRKRKPFEGGTNCRVKIETALLSVSRSWLLQERSVHIHAYGSAYSWNLEKSYFIISWKCFYLSLNRGDW